MVINSQNSDSPFLNSPGYIPPCACGVCVFSLFACFVGIFFFAGIALAYLRGYATGKREGFEHGKAAGKKEGSVKAFAVGYDRGKHDREVEQQNEEEPPPKKGCVVSFLLILTPTLLAVVGLVLLADRPTF